jgi:hypothetical protein
LLNINDAGASDLARLLFSGKMCDDLRHSGKLSQIGAEDYSASEKVDFQFPQKSFA